MNDQQLSYCGLGRRKTSVARVRLYPDLKQLLVNGQPIDQYLNTSTWVNEVLRPLELTGTRERFGMKALVDGGGKHGQAGALRLGVARALVEADPSFRLALRQAGMLTRDPRMVERKKYGLRKARRRPQFSKR
jgi:small subunit ribosomal protein S9